MKTFQPGDIVTIPGLYLLTGDPPREVVLINGAFVDRLDHSRRNERHRHFQAGAALPDLGYANQKWVLFREA